MKIAIDIGYGHTKVKTDHKEFKFPTAVAVSKTQMVETDSILFEGKKYLVGEDALRGAIMTRDYAFIYKYAPLLIYEAIRLAGLGDEEKLQINAGLSLYDLEKKPEFDNGCLNRKEEFKKRISSFVINDTQYRHEIKLYAQGQGSWSDFCESYGYLERGYEVLVDIGYRTNDILVFKDGSPNKAESQADDKGINIIVAELRKILNKKYDITLTEQEVSEILKDGYVTIYGVEKDLSNVISEVVEAYLDELFSLLKAEFGSILKSSKRVIITGGGAYILYDYREMFPQNVIFDEKQEFEYSNVRGYYNG